MSTPKPPPSGPITDVLKRVKSETEEQDPLNPALLLAELMDLRGSVVLAQYIAGEQNRPEPEPSHPQSILAMTAKTIEDVRSRLDFAMTNAFRPRFRLPTAQRAWNVLNRTGITDRSVPKTKKERRSALRSGTRIIWAPFGEFMDVQLKRSRFAIKELRDELAGPLAGLGPEVAAIERMDAALRTSIDSEVNRLYQRIGTHSEQRFSEALKNALEELPQASPEGAFSLGFSETGWLGAIFREGMELVQAVMENEIQAIENLVDKSLSVHQDSHQA